MLCRIISVGRIKESFYRQGLEEYSRRLAFYTPFELRDNLEEKYPDRADAGRIQACLEREGQKILDIVGADYLLLLDVRGPMLSSEGLASRVEAWSMSGIKRLNLVVGGAYGVSPSVRQRADESLSLSPMTFPHQMAVLIAAEQLYRAYTIVRGGKYHHS